MKFSFFVIWFFLASTQESCDARKQNIEATDRMFEECKIYPSIVDSLGLQKFYDSARWYIYIWNCDIPYRPKSDSLKQGSFGELNLRFDHIEMKSDSVEFIFNFSEGDNIVISTALMNFTELYTGVGYNVKTNKKLYMSSPSGFLVNEKGPASRYENPLQPEVLYYLKNNWRKLNPCFKRLADSVTIFQ